MRFEPVNDWQRRIFPTRIAALEVERGPACIGRCEEYLAMGMRFTVAPGYGRRNEVYA